ncbi:MAG: aldo/keto reductase [Alphaproteobacteria bacterium]|nr:aldo/keto reductase [Alphaproteobacteria bacterium]
MHKRMLGNSGLEIAPLALGCNVFGWTADEATSFTLLDAFLAAGFNYIDTADSYSRWVPGNKGGESETIIGRWLKERGGRDKIILGTKVGMPMPGVGQGLSRAWITQEVENSLRRLQTDYIDLYMAHTDDAAVPQAETLETFASLVRQGKARAIGASNFTASRLSQALDTSAGLGLPRYESLQPNYSIAERTEFEGELEALCVRERLGVICYYSLASGFLTGKYRSKADTTGTARGASVEKHMNDRGMRILAALDEVAAQCEARPGQVALAWLMARPSITAPIASARSLDQLEEIMQATRIRLGPAQIDLINAASGT